jgi:hypothetical protein
MDSKLLDTIYKQFVDNPFYIKNTRNNMTITYCLDWRELLINDIQSLFMGNLFIKSIYSDEILYKLTKLLLKNIEKTLPFDHKIYFYISKILTNTNINDSLIIL